MRIGQAIGMIGATISLMLAAACGPIVDLSEQGKAPRLFQLNPASGLVPGATPLELTILVERPTVPGSLSSDFIAVRTGEHEVKYLSGARWSDRAGALLTNYVIESIEMSGIVGVIGVESLDLPNDYRLKLDVQEFSAIVEGRRDQPIERVHVKISATVVRSKPVEILAARSFSSSTAVGSNDPERVVAALNGAADRVLGDLVAWMLPIIKRSEAASGSK